MRVWLSLFVSLLVALVLTAVALGYTVFSARAPSVNCQRAAGCYPAARPEPAHKSSPARRATYRAATRIE